MEVVASLSQGRTAAVQCGLFTHKSVAVIFEPPCIYVPSVKEVHAKGGSLAFSYYRTYLSTILKRRTKHFRIAFRLYFLRHCAVIMKVSVTFQC